MPVYGRIGHARVTAGEAGAEVIRAGGAEVRQRQVVEIKVTGRVDGYLGVAAVVAGGNLPFERRRGHDPFESHAAVERMPDPARIGRSSSGRARINPIRIRRIDPERLLEAGPADPADDWVPEGGRS